MSKNLEETYLCGGHNTPYPILVIGLTYLSKKGGWNQFPHPHTFQRPKIVHSSMLSMPTIKETHVQFAHVKGM